MLLDNFSEFRRTVVQRDLKLQIETGARALVVLRNGGRPKSLESDVGAKFVSKTIFCLLPVHGIKGYSRYTSKPALFAVLFKKKLLGEVLEAIFPNRSF